MENLRVDGIHNISGGEYRRVQIDGIARCEGDISAESVDVDGIFRCSGNVETGSLDCDGIMNIEGNIRAQKVDIDGIVSVKGGTKIESREIFCDGVIKINGEISADRIEADGCISAREIVGEYIHIHSHGQWFMNFIGIARSRISLIEATTIELRGVVAQTVNGRDVVIGPGCRIGNIDCSGVLRISKKAKVAQISGDHRREDM